MKILFRNTTKYTKEDYNSFTKFHSKKYGKKELAKIILGIMFFLYLFVVNIIYMNWIFFVVLIIVGGIIYRLNTKKAEKKRNNKNKEKEYTFYFYEKYIKIKYRRRFERLMYFQIYKIFETKEHFFLYLDEKRSLILNKNGFEIGTPKEFAKFIKRKCPFKYKEEKSK